MTGTCTNNAETMANECMCDLALLFPHFKVAKQTALLKSLGTK